MKLLLLVLLLTATVYGQDKIIKKLEKELNQSLPVLVYENSIQPDNQKLKTIYSRTIDSVIIGHSYAGEFVNVSNTDQRTPFSNAYLTDFVSKNDFFLFRSWIIDSMARDCIIYGFRDREDRIEWLDLSKEEKKRFKKAKRNPQHGIHGDYIPFELEHSNYDWSKKLDYNDPELIPLLIDLYLTPQERFRGNKSIDYRKIGFQLGATGVHNFDASRVPIFVDAHYSEDATVHFFDQFAVMSILNDFIYLDHPITKIEPFMASAYCLWKSEQLNKQLDLDKFEVKCRLPKVEEVLSNPNYFQGESIEIYDHTKEWQITNNEFREFSEYTLDSVCREYLYINTDDHKLALECE